MFNVEEGTEEERSDDFFLMEKQLFPLLERQAAVPWIAPSVPSLAGFLGRGFPRGGHLGRVPVALHGRAGCCSPSLQEKHLEIGKGGQGSQ